MKSVLPSRLFRRPVRPPQAVDNPPRRPVKRHGRPHDDRTLVNSGRQKAAVLLAVGIAVYALALLMSEVLRRK